MNGVVECSYCHAKLGMSPNARTVSKAYDRHRSTISSKFYYWKVLMVVFDCILIGLQPMLVASAASIAYEQLYMNPILVYISKVDGKFLFSPVSVNFLTEGAKVIFAIFMLIFQARRQKPGEKSILSLSKIVQAARANYLLAVPALLYAVNNYLKFIMQLYFNPATVKMLSNSKILVIALLLRVIMMQKLSIMQWEALVLLLIGITVNQLRLMPEGVTALGFPAGTAACVCTLFFVTVPALASVYNELALKSQFETSIYLQNLFLYGYGAVFNFIAILIMTVFKGANGFSIFEGHSKATMLLIINNAAQGILSSFFFKYADTILKKYSSTVATIFTGLASAALFGHSLTINFILGITIVFISMHQYFSEAMKIRNEAHCGNVEKMDVQNNYRLKESTYIDVESATANDAHEREKLLPI